MDSQRLQFLLEEILTCIDDFRKELVESEGRYQESLKLITDSKVSSLLMEEQVVHIERQRAALNKMEVLYDQVQDQISGPSKFK